MNYKGKVLFCDVQTTPTLYFRQKKKPGSQDTLRVWLKTKKNAFLQINRNNRLNANISPHVVHTRTTCRYIFIGIL